MTMRGIRASRFEFVGEPALCFGFGEAGDPLGGGRERDSVTAAGWVGSEGDGEVCFSGSGRAEEDHVVGFWDEVELVEVGDLGSGHRTLVSEVEVVEGLGLGEPGRADAVLAAVGFAGCDFFGEDLDQQLEGVPPYRERRIRRSSGRRWFAWSGRVGRLVS